MDQDKIGLFIQTLRKNKGMTQKELSEKLGVSDKTISKWETGHGLPDTLVLSRLCQTLEVSVGELLSGEKLLPENYSERTEKTIVTLLKEKENMKKSGWVQVIICSALLVVGIYLAIMSNGLSPNVEWYWSSPAFIALLMVSVSCALAASIRKKGNFVSTMRHVVLPVGAILGLYELMTALIFYDSSMADPLAALIICLVACIQPLFYAFIIYLALTVWKGIVN